MNVTTISQKRQRGPAETRLLFAAAVRAQCCQVCATSGDGRLLRVRVIRRADGCRVRALVCEGCLPKAGPDYAVLHLIAN